MRYGGHLGRGEAGVEMDLSMEENIIRVPLTAGKGSGHQNNALKNCPETLAKVTHFTGAIVEHTHVTIFASRSSARLSRAGEDV